MRQIVLPKHGPPEVFEDRQVGELRPARGDVLVGTRAAGVNFADILQRLGLYDSAPSPPYVMGFELAGRVEAVGDGVNHLSSGDAVVAMLKRGAYAEQVVVPTSQVFRVPESLSLEQAAALPVNWLTAWFCLFTMGNLRSDEVVLVHGGAGGVGSAAVQLAREHGATVVSTAGSEAKLEFLDNEGVTLSVNYRQDDWDERIRDRFGESGIDLVLDPVGGSTTRRSYELLAPLGRLVFYGMSSAVSGPSRSWLTALRAWWRTPRFSPLQMTTDNTAVWGFHLAHLDDKQQRVREAMEGVLKRVGDGDVRPVIDSTFPLDASGASAAHRHIHGRRNIGKVLLVRE